MFSVADTQPLFNKASYLSCEVIIIIIIEVTLHQEKYKKEK